MIIFSQKYLQSNLFNSYTLEQQLLLCCARVQLNNAFIDKIKYLLCCNLNWSLLIQSAEDHQITSLLYQNLSKLPSDLLPENILLDLRKRHYANIASSMIISHELFQILKQFSTVDIPIIPYKGPVLAVSVYKDSSLRNYSDLDFLISPADMGRIETFLFSQGYQIQEQELWEKAFSHPEKNAVLDIHEGLGQTYFPFRVDFDYYYQNLCAVDLCGENVWSFTPEDLLIILAIQLAKDCHHCKFQLIKVCDVAELLSRYSDLSWEKVLKQSEMMRCQRLLLLALLLTHKLIGSPLNQSILDMIFADWIVCRYGDLLCRSFFKENTFNYLEFLLKKSLLIDYPISSSHNKFLIKYTLRYFWKNLS